MVRSFRHAFWVAAAFAAFVPVTAFGQAYGKFNGEIATEWMPDGRSMRLLKQFEYTAADGTRWGVPAGSIVDGASIPQALWSLIGAPFSGNYRNASVIHDYYCETRSRPYQAVHQVFYEAMLASGVGQRRAWLMYRAVDTFGPRWDTVTANTKCDGPDFDFENCVLASKKPALRQPQLDAAALKKFTDDVRGEADPEDVRQLEEAIGALKHN